MSADDRMSRIVEIRPDGSFEIWWQPHVPPDVLAATITQWRSQDVDCGATYFDALAYREFGIGEAALREARS